MLCEQLSECRNLDVHATQGAELSKDDVEQFIGDVLAQETDVVADDEDEGDLLVQSSDLTGNTMRMMSSLFQMRMSSQMMMQAMAMRAQQQQNEHKMMEKVTRAMSRNRAIRAELKRLKKAAFRAQPVRRPEIATCPPHPLTDSFASRVPPPGQLRLLQRVPAGEEEEEELNVSDFDCVMLGCCRPRPPTRSPLRPCPPSRPWT